MKRFAKKVQCQLLKVLKIVSKAVLRNKKSVIRKEKEEEEVRVRACRTNHQSGLSQLTVTNCCCCCCCSGINCSSSCWSLLCQLFVCLFYFTVLPLPPLLLLFLVSFYRTRRQLGCRLTADASAAVDRPVDKLANSLTHSFTYLHSLMDSAHSFHRFFFFLFPFPFSAFSIPLFCLTAWLTDWSSGPPPTNVRRETSPHHTAPLFVVVQISPSIFTQCRKSKPSFFFCFLFFSCHFRFFSKAAAVAAAASEACCCAVVKLLEEAFSFFCGQRWQSYESDY